MPKAPEIFKIKLDEIDLDGLPPRDSDGFEDAVIQYLSLKYAGKGHAAVVTVDGDYVRGVAVPADGIEPVEYVLGLLREGFLEDALPALEVLSDMLGEPEIDFNYGLCLSELGKHEAAIEPLMRCVDQKPDHHHALVALGVAHLKLGRQEQAEGALRSAVAVNGTDHWANRNLAALLSRSGRSGEAIEFFRKALEAQPGEPGTQLGLAGALEEVGGDNLREAIHLYRGLADAYPEHPIGDLAREGSNRIAAKNLKGNVDGGLRMDAVMYMHSAFRLFEGMDRQEIGKIVLEIARLGDTGLEINNPDKRYALNSLSGDFSGLNLLSLMHVGLKILEPSADPQSGLDDEFEAAKAMRG